MRLIGRVTLVVAALAVLALGAGASYLHGPVPVPDGYAFPRHSLWGSGPGGLYQGTLADDDGCIRATGDEEVTVVWPPGYRLGLGPDGPTVHAGGRQVAMGQAVRLGGGWYDRDQLRGVAAGAAETRCPGPFFLTTGFVD